MDNTEFSAKTQEPMPDRGAIGIGLDEIGFPHALFAINPDRKGDTESQSFDAEQRVDAIEWAFQRNVEGYGVFFHVNVLQNELRANFQGKAAKGDIRAARFVHVDLDAEKGAPGWSDADKASKIDELNDLPAPPSMIFDSGNGLYPLWRLDGEYENLESIEAVNRGVCEALAGDRSATDISRILRLPGTVNHPGELKRSWGRVPVMTAIAQSDDGTVCDAHELSVQFPAPPKEETPERVAIDLGEYKLITCDDLDIMDTPWLRKAIEEPKGTDRSAYGYHAAAECVRAGLSDTEIAGLLANPDNPAAEHFVDQGDPMRAIRRAIGAARGAEPDSQPIPMETREAVARLAEAANDDGHQTSREAALLEKIPRTPFDIESEPGLLGDMARWVRSSSFRPTDGFALPATLAVLSTMFGRRYATPTGLGLNLVAVAVAETGTGKEAVLEASHRLLHAAGLSRRIGPGDFTSDTAIEKSLRTRPCQLMALDEFGKLMQILMNKNQASHQVGAVKAMLTLYTKSGPNSLWTGKARANDEKLVEDEPILAPTLTMLGVSTPAGFYKGLNPDTLDDGFVNRLTLFAAGKPGPRNYSPDRTALPEELANALKDAISKSRGSGDLASAFSDAASIKPDMINAKWADDEAEQVFRSILDWQDYLVEEKGKAWVAVRAAEQVSKIATLRACARHPDAPCVSVEDMAWAFAIVHSSISMLEDGARTMMAGSPFQQACNTIREAITTRGANGIHHSKLVAAKGVSAIEPRMFDMAVGRLKETGDIEVIGKLYRLSDIAA